MNEITKKKISESCKKAIKKRKALDPEKYKMLQGIAGRARGLAKHKNAKLKDPEGYKLQQSKAGKKGIKVVIAKYKGEWGKKGGEIRGQQIKDDPEKHRQIIQKTFDDGRIIWNKGIHISDKHKNNMKTTIQKQFDDGRIVWNKGKPFEEKTKIKMKHSAKIRANTPEGKARLKEQRARQIFPLNDTKIEIKIQQLLSELNINFLKHHPIRDIQHSYNCDVFIPCYNVVIECDGNYWHDYPDLTSIDLIRNQELQNAGYKLLRLWESEIKLITKDILNLKIKEKINC